MIQTVFKESFRMLDKNWLKISGVVILTYFIKLIAETLPIQGTVIIQMDPLSVFTSGNLQSILLGAFVNSILFFILIHYITLSQVTMRNRLLTAVLYPFKNPKLLYKGLFVLFLTNLLLDLVGRFLTYGALGGLITLAAGLNVATGLFIVLYIALFSLVIWTFLGVTQAMYILHDEPNLGIFRSIKQSFGLMKGERWSLIGFFLITGLGLIIGILIFVLGALVVLVIYEMARLAYYQELLRKKRQKDWQANFND